MTELVNKYSLVSDA